METLVDVISLKEEKVLLSDFIDSTLDFVAELYPKCKDTEKSLNNQYGNGHEIQNQHFELVQNQQNYLSLINPNIIVISDQFGQLNWLISSFENVVDNMPSELKQNNEFLKKKQLIHNNIQEEKEYFKPFDCLHNKHLYVFKQLIDFDVLARKIHIHNLLDSIISTSDNSLADISTIDFANYIDRIQEGRISLKQLRKDNFYANMKIFMQYFYENKDALKEKVFNAYVSENKLSNTNQKKINKLQNLHKYYADSLNELYEKECAHIPQIGNVQTNLRNLEEFIYDFTNYYSCVSAS